MDNNKDTNKNSWDAQKAEEWSVALERAAEEAVQRRLLREKKSKQS